MKPISLLRMRARSEKERSATCLPFSQYLPSDGVSSRPRIERSVVLPQPEGPAIETYSPFLISRWMPASACVSTSSVMKTLVTPSRWISEPLPLVPFIVFSLLVQANVVVPVPGGGVREDHLLAGGQAAHHLDGIDRAAAELDRHSPGLLAAVRELEHLDRALRLPIGWAADVEHVLEALDLDGAVDGEVDASSLGERAVERGVDDDRAVLHGGGDAD